MRKINLLSLALFLFLLIMIIACEDSRLIVNSDNGKITIDNNFFTLHNTSNKTIRFIVKIKHTKSINEKTITLPPGGKEKLLDTIKNYNNLLKQIAIVSEQEVQGITKQPGKGSSPGPPGTQTSPKPITGPAKAFTTSLGGLTMEAQKEEYIITIGEGGILYASREGLIGKDAQGNLWRSRKIDANPDSKIAFFPVPEGSQPTEDPYAAKMDDLFTMGGKPLAVWLKRNDEGKWDFKFEPAMTGATARVPMEGGVVVELVVKVQKSVKSNEPQYFIDAKLNKKEIRLTVRKLPSGQLAPLMLSEKRYGNGFRLAWEDRLNGYSLYMMKDPEKPEK